MALADKQTVSTYNMVNHAEGLANFILGEISFNIPNYFDKDVVYVMDEEGNHVKQARFEEITLENGKKIYNIVLTMDS